VVENDGQRRCFLGRTPDRDSQFGDELMRVEAQCWLAVVKGFKGVCDCGSVGGFGRGDLRSSRVAQDW